MDKIKIFTDSTNDLTKEILEENNISVVPLYVNFKDELYKDSIDIDSSLLYEKVDQLGILPKTSAPSPMDFLNPFKEYIDLGYQIIYIGLSSKISATIQNSILGSNEFEDRVRVIDSLNLATGVGLLVMKASDLVKENCSVDEIERVLLEMRDRINTSFIVDNLEYLHKGGRCSALENILGSMLNIKPVIEVKDGTLGVRKKIRGKKEKMVKYMKTEIINNIDNIDKERFFITHSRCDDFVYTLRDELLRETDLKNIIITETGSIISSHCGPGTLGLVYLEK